MTIDIVYVQYNGGIQDFEDECDYIDINKNFKIIFEEMKGWWIQPSARRSVGETVQLYDEQKHEKLYEVISSYVGRAVSRAQRIAYDPDKYNREA